jgi:hypothetical protein
MKKYDFFGIFKVPEEESDLDPLVRDMDLRIRICTKMSGIPNTVSKTDFIYLAALLAALSSKAGRKYL